MGFCLCCQILRGYVVHLQFLQSIDTILLQTGSIKLHVAQICLDFTGETKQTLQKDHGVLLTDKVIRQRNRVNLSESTAGIAVLFEVHDVTVTQHQACK